MNRKTDELELAITKGEADQGAIKNLFDEKDSHIEELKA